MIDVGLKLTVTFFGIPEADSAIVGDPCVTLALIVLAVLPPLLTVSELGLAKIVNVAGAAVIVSETAVVFVNPPPFPDTVTV